MKTVFIKEFVMKSNERIDVVIPVYNEEKGLPEFIERLTALPLNIHPVFVDNASTDGSVELMRQVAGATVIEHERNEGYGASLRDGIQASTAEKIVIIDADCEYPPEALPDIVAELDTHSVVYTSRFLNKEEQTPMPLLKMAGNSIISGLFNLLFNQHTTDLYTGSKGFRRSAIVSLPMQRNGFEHVLEIAVRLARRGYTIHEIHVKFRPRQTGTAKMKHLPETIKYLYLLLLYFITIPFERRR